MTEPDVNDFSEEKTCVYKEEKYSVRDNGAVLRHSKNAGKNRKLDNVWTFGKESAANGYLHIANARIHRIVATAFHGEPPDPEDVVDHIDTNRQNNRPENLRWLSRLENTLNNPVTRRKIVYLCGSIEAYLENPSMLNDLQVPRNLLWMRTVTPEEAQNCKMRMSLWAKSTNKATSSTGASSRKNSFGKRVFKPLQKWEAGLAGEPGLDFASTPWCAVYMWRGNPYFPCCPHELGMDPLNDYFQNLKTGAVLAYDDHEDFCPKHIVVDSKLLKDKSSIIVISERSDDKWSVVGIELNEKSHFIHFVLGSYPSKDEADKAFVSKREKDFWSEGYNNAYK